MFSAPFYSTAEAIEFGSLFRNPGGSADGSPHLGIDIRLVVGGRIRAAAAGLVSYVKDGSDNGGATKMVYIRHNKKYTTMYVFEPLQTLYVAQGDYVQAGQLIGTAASRQGQAIGQVHFTVMANESMDNCPMMYLDADGRRMFRELYNLHPQTGLIDPCYQHTTAEGYSTGCPSLFGQP
ncbi:MAG: M23 family metallopeptidase [Candidatus Saganbacteria bacterium]|nr:M23 family metallopeptidase [Candidatus Saganbacteria bacterium]